MSTARSWTSWGRSPTGRGIYLHLTTPADFGFRVVEIWDKKEGFDRFVEHRLAPASEEVGLQREMTITVTPLHNFFAPRLTELPDLVATLPGAPRAPRLEHDHRSAVVGARREEP